MRKILKILFLWIPCIFVLSSLLLVTLLKWIPVYYTPLMIVRAYQGVKAPDGVQSHHWVPLEMISVNMQKSVVASEDNRFFTHNGFDIEEIRKMRAEHEKKGKPIRGCSTISQQTAKNCFTFGTRTWWRKAFEAYYTVLIEKIWGKRRILEVYLNVAETGKGLYGVESAAQYYFNIPASRMTLSDAAALTCCLPNPLKRTPQWVNRKMTTRKAQIADLTAKIDFRLQ